jgi:hypothetical protein
VDPQFRIQTGDFRVRAAAVIMHFRWSAPGMSLAIERNAP